MFKSGVILSFKKDYLVQGFTLASSDYEAARSDLEERAKKVLGNDVVRRVTKDGFVNRDGDHVSKFVVVCSKRPSQQAMIAFPNKVSVKVQKTDHFAQDPIVPVILKFPLIGLSPSLLRAA